MLGCDRFTVQSDKAEAKQQSFVVTFWSAESHSAPASRRRRAKVPALAARATCGSFHKVSWRFCG